MLYIKQGREYLYCATINCHLIKIDFILFWLLKVKLHNRIRIRLIVKVSMSPDE